MSPSSSGPAPARSSARRGGKAMVAPLSRSMTILSALAMSKQPRRGARLPGGAGFARVRPRRLEEAHRQRRRHRSRRGGRTPVRRWPEPPPERLVGGGEGIGREHQDGAGGEALKRPGRADIAAPLPASSSASRRRASRAAIWLEGLFTYASKKPIAPGSWSQSACHFSVSDSVSRAGRDVGSRVGLSVPVCPFSKCSCSGGGSVPSCRDSAL